VEATESGISAELLKPVVCNSFNRSENLKKLTVRQLCVHWIVQHSESWDYFAPAKSQLTQIYVWKQPEMELLQKCGNQ